MNAVILLSLVIASAMAAPAPQQLLQSGLTLQSAGGIPTAFLTSSPQLFTTQQFVQQPAFLAAQTAIQQEEAAEAQEHQQEIQQQQQQQQEAAALVRDPSSPTTDIFLHSGFPLVSQLQGAQGGLQSPFTLTSSPFTRVGLTSTGVQQQSAQLVAAPQAQSAQLVAAAPQAQSAQLVAAPQQQATQFFTTTGQQFQTQQVAAAPQQQQTFSFQPLQATSVQQPQQQQQQQQVAVQQQAAASPTQFSSGPLIFTTSQQQPSTLTGFRTVASPFTFQTVATQ